MADSYKMVFVTAPKSASRPIARAVLKLRLAACVNIVPGLSSVYWWKGKIETSKESLLIIKTRSSLVKDLMAKIRKVHPYDVPEIIALPITQGHPPYLAWIKNETKKAPR